MNVVLKRVVVSFFFIPLILLVLFNGGTLLMIFLSLLTALGTYEMYDMSKKKSPALPTVIIPLNVLFLIAFSYVNAAVIMLAVFLVVFLIAAYDILLNRFEGTLVKVSLSLFTIIYIPFFLSYAYHVSLLDGGSYLLISIIIVIWLTDTFAYFIGMALGKHKGVFRVSPKKSAEGFIAGFISAMLFSYLLHIIFDQHISLLQGIIIGISAGIIGQFGDLVESLIKRNTGVKDSSTIIPGHGGVLDRFDSFLFAVPVFYLLNYLLI